MRIIIIKEWDKYWRLTIQKELPIRTTPYWMRYRMMECKCVCWNIRNVRLSDLRKKWKWRTLSCWCHMRDNNKKLNTTHWQSHSRIYSIWNWMNDRCYNPKIGHYHRYWWRWIKIEWETFEEFYKDMIDWYADHLSIDREDNDWNYTKNNCRWVTKKEQCRNRRTNRIYDWKTIAEWCEIQWIQRSIVDWRLNRWWSTKRALKL